MHLKNNNTILSGGFCQYDYVTAILKKQLQTDLKSEVLVGFKALQVSKLHH